MEHLISTNVDDGKLDTENKTGINHLNAGQDAHRPPGPDNAKHSPGFDIKTAGQPKLLRNLSIEDGKIAARFSWTLPDLGVDGTNYELQKIEATLQREGEPSKSLVAHQNHECDPVNLVVGKQYTLTVVCNYTDLKTSEIVSVPATQKFDTENKPPKFHSIEFDNDVISIDWSKGRWMTKHRLKILDAKEHLLKETDLKEQPHTLKISPKYSYGRSCKFVIEGTLLNGTMKTAVKEKIIGGDFVATDVIAHVEGRSLTISWKPPKQKLIRCELLLHKITKNEEEYVDSLDITNPQQTRGEFGGLQSSSKYQCKVIPKFKNKDGHAVVSNVVQTSKRKQLAIENDNNFGKSTGFNYSLIKTKDGNDLELSWTPPQVGINFKIAEHIVSMLKKDAGDDRPVFHKRVEAGVADVTIPNIKKGCAYLIKVCTNLEDLDDLKKCEKTAEYTFIADLEQTTVDDCALKDETIIFTWSPVNGAEEYKLEIWDEYQHEKIKVQTVKGECLSRVPVEEKLGIGRKCATKVIACRSGAQSSTSKWKTQLIGGDKVVRNVKVAQNKQNPCRSVKISFDSPNDGEPKIYKVVAVPDSGRRKTRQTQSSPCIFDYLRKGVTYHFEVSAMWNDKFTEPCRSKNITTSGDNERPKVEINAAQSTVTMQGVTIQGDRNVKVIEGGSFGQVRDLDHDYHGGTEHDFASLSWKTPTFNQNPKDYKIEKFKLMIKKGGSIHVIDYLDNNCAAGEYTTKKYKMEWGEKYHVTIATIYEDIDEDQLFISDAARIKITTRPCRPKINQHDDTKKLKLDWSEAKGASNYKVEIHIKPHEVITKEVTTSTFERDFDKVLGFGKTYYVDITAIAEGGKCNKHSTETRTIGGSRVPTSVTADIRKENINDPSSQVFLTWNAPEIRQDEEITGYNIIAESNKTPVEYTTGNSTTYLISELKAGTEYYFNIAVNILRDGNTTTSDGCYSNKIQTNPRPHQVKNVITRCGGNPGTSQIVTWDKVNDETQNDRMEYRLALKSTKEAAWIIERIITCWDNKFTICGLEPTTTYTVTVSAGNSSGFGRPSEEILFATDIGKPKHVNLVNNSQYPSTSLVLTFSEAEGLVAGYEVQLCQCYNDIDESFPKIKKIDVASGTGKDKTLNYSNLDPNSKYFVEICTVTKSSKVCSLSNYVLTAPSKPTIFKSGCYDEKGKASANEVFAEFTADPGCDLHEITIRCGSCIEQILVQDQNKVKYTCKNKAVQYSLQVRSRNKSGHFGEMSDISIVYLAPRKPQCVQVFLYNDKIKLTCQKDVSVSNYYMKVLKRKEKEQKDNEEPQVGDMQSDRPYVEWIYTPQEHAQQYVFEVWATRQDNEREIRGQSSVTPSITSKPKKATIQRVEIADDPFSTDINILWEKLERCNVYEVKIQIVGKQECESFMRIAKNYCRYKCLVSGQTYSVTTRAICGQTEGEWSDPKRITLAPEEVEISEDSCAMIETVESVLVTWKPLDIEPEGYVLNAFCDCKRMTDQLIQTTHVEYTFNESLIPGSLFYCTVAAYTGNRIGKATKSKIYRIAWSKPEQFLLSLDVNKPTKRAVIEWSKPHGVTQYKLEIENNQTGEVTTCELSTTKYIFKSGIPGNSYSVRLYCGCDGRYDPDCSNGDFSFQPEPPMNIKAAAYRQCNGLYITVIDNPSPRKLYEIILKSPKNNEIIFKKTTKDQSTVVENLIPGETYHVSVKTIVGDLKSVEARSTGITVPSIIENFSSAQKDGNVQFVWDSLAIIPDSYIIQWRCNNEKIVEEHNETTFFSIKCVKAACSYSIRVAASNVSGCGPFTPWHTVSTAPEPPAGVKVRADKGSKGLNIEVIDELSPRKSYKINLEAQTNHEEISKELSKGQSLLVVDLIPGETYEISVKTKIDDLESESAWTTGCTYPAIIKKIIPLVRDGMIQFTWEPLAIRPDEYVIQWKSNNEQIIEERTKTTSFSINGFEATHIYSIRVAAFNASGCGPFTSWEAITTAPDPPADIKVTADRRSNGLTIKVNDHPAARKLYIICLEAQTSHKKVFKKVTKSQSLLVSDLVPGETYNITVKTKFGELESEEALTTGCTIPAEIQELNCELKDSKIVFEWRPLDIAPDEYLVQWRVDNEQPISDETNAAAFSINRFKPAHLYNVRVAASNVSGHGRWTPWKTFITAPLPPTDVKVSRNEQSPQKSLIVTFKDEIDVQKKYIVKAFLNKEKVAQVSTKKHVVYLDDLKPANSYIVTVQTEFCGVLSEVSYQEKPNNY